MICGPALPPWDVPVGGGGVRGRVLVRFLVVLMAVAGMILAPVVTWPSSGQPNGAMPAPVTSGVSILDHLLVDGEDHAP
jgi:hypothetical protein